MRMKKMKRMMNKTLPYIGMAVLIFGICVCYMTAAYSDQGGSDAVVAVNSVKGLAIVIIGAFLSRWRV